MRVLGTLLALLALLALATAQVRPLSDLKSGAVDAMQPLRDAVELYIHTSLPDLDESGKDAEIEKLAAESIASIDASPEPEQTMSEILATLASATAEFEALNNPDG